MIQNKTLIENTVKSGYIFISDIHGNKNTLKLIERARHDYPDFTLVGGGDYIDGRKDSKLVLDYLMQSQNSVILRGNHEQMLMDFAEGRDEFINDDYGTLEPLWWVNGGKTTLLSLFHKRANMHNIRELQCQLLNSKYYAFLKKTQIMYDTPHIIFVHGGVLPIKDYADSKRYLNVEFSDYDSFRMWARESYWHKPFETVRDSETGIPARWDSSKMGYFSRNKTGKTIVTGHTPTALICGAYEDWSVKNKHCILPRPFTHCDVLSVQYKDEPARIFTDGGCHSRQNKHWGNVVVLDSNGQILKIYNYEYKMGIKYEEKA